MITIEKSPNAGYFRVDGIDYAKNQYIIKYDNIDKIESERNFSLCLISDNSKLIVSRGYAEITGINNWAELLELLVDVVLLGSNDVNVVDQIASPFDFFFTSHFC